jgi:tripartite-type tricarboxylate transporter receptor subunit TctC
MNRLAIPCTATFAVAALALSACGAGGGNSGAFPTKRIEVVVPYPAGGATDSLARIWSQCFEEELGETVTVVNREGGQGATGSRYVADAKPDGYTLLASSDSTYVVSPQQSEDTGYDYDDFDYIAMLGYSPDVFYTRPDSEFQTIEDLAAALQSGDESVTVAEYSPITSTAIRGASMAAANGFEWNVVPFDSAADKAQSVAAGDSDVGYGDINIPLVELVEAGKLMFLGSAEDLAAYDDAIPTLEESGLDTYAGENAGIVYLAGPQDMPSDVVDALESAVTECADSNDTISNALQVQLRPDSGTMGEELDELVEQSYESYGAAIAESQ